MAILEGSLSSTNKHNPPSSTIQGQGNTSWSHRGGQGRGSHNIDRVQDHGRGMNNVEPPPQKPSSTKQTINQKQVCYMCGCDGHWSCTCRTRKHLVEAYQRIQKDKKGKVIQGCSIINVLSIIKVNVYFSRIK